MTDKEIKQRLVDMETAKIHRCAERLMAKGTFTSKEFNQTLKEYGVAANYFYQLYQVDWCYEWVKEYSMTFEEFLSDIVFEARKDRDFRDVFGDKLTLEHYSNQYKLNGNNVDKYNQQYVYRIAFKKKDRLTLPY